MGEMTVACVPSAVQYFLPPALRRYHARFPNIRVRIVGEGATDVLTCVVRGEAEFGLNYIGAQDAEIEFVPILREPFVLVCRHDHPIARKREIGWAELGAVRFITVAKASGNRLVMDLALAGLPDQPRWFYEVRHVSMLPPLVEAGLGVAALRDGERDGSVSARIRGSSPVHAIRWTVGRSCRACTPIACLPIRSRRSSRESRQTCLINRSMPERRPTHRETCCTAGTV
jgi:DNA-binding transcriptional LysR family regulator